MLIYLFGRKPGSVRTTAPQLPHLHLEPLCWPQMMRRLVKEVGVLLLCTFGNRDIRATRDHQLPSQPHGVGHLL